jgi:hypothetical protein
LLYQGHLLKAGRMMVDVLMTCTIRSRLREIPFAAEPR